MHTPTRRLKALADGPFYSSDVRELFFHVETEPATAAPPVSEILPVSDAASVAVVPRIWRSGPMSPKWQRCWGAKIKPGHVCLDDRSPYRLLRDSMSRLIRRTRRRDCLRAGTGKLRDEPQKNIALNNLGNVRLERRP